jgi:hypothetical protein
MWYVPCRNFNTLLNTASSPKTVNTSLDRLNVSAIPVAVKE